MADKLPQLIETTAKTNDTAPHTTIIIAAHLFTRWYRVDRRRRFLRTGIPPLPSETYSVLSRPAEAGR